MKKMRTTEELGRIRRLEMLRRIEETKERRTLWRMGKVKEQRKLGGIGKAKGRNVGEEERQTGQKEKGGRQEIIGKGQTINDERKRKKEPETENCDGKSREGK